MFSRHPTVITLARLGQEATPSRFEGCSFVGPCCPSSYPPVHPIILLSKKTAKEAFDLRIVQELVPSKKSEDVLAAAEASIE